MIKSYQESNGTSLSTDWASVSKVSCVRWRGRGSRAESSGKRRGLTTDFICSQGKVETLPPDVSQPPGSEWIEEAPLWGC